MQASCSAELTEPGTAMTKSDSVGRRKTRDWKRFHTSAREQYQWALWRSNQGLSGGALARALNACAMHVQCIATRGNALKRKLCARGQRRRRYRLFFFRHRHENIGKRANLVLRRALRRIDEKVAEAVARDVIEGRDEHPGFDSVSCHPRIADSDTVPLRGGGECQLQCVENQSLVGIDIFSKRTIEPASPFVMTGSGMQQRDAREVG